MKQTDIDFSQPQKESLLGIFLEFTNSLQQFVKAMLPFIAVTLFSDKEKKGLFYLLLGLVVLVGALVTGYFKYKNFRFFIEDNTEFVVRKGIFKKTRIAIPLHKIQQVNINQNFFQRLLKLYSVEIDTAGSAKTEVTINAVTEQFALALKERLLKHSAIRSNTTGEAANELQDKQAPFIQVSFMSLLKTGITSNYIRSFGILLAFFISTFQHLDEYLSYTDTKSDFINEYVNAAFLLRFIAFITFTILLLILVINLGRTLLRFYNYKVTKQQNSLLLSHGLINTRNTIIRQDKVQIITVGRNYFQKKFNINDIKIRQASDLEVSKERAKMSMEIPGLNEDEKNEVLHFLFDKMPKKGFALKPNFRKVVLEIVKIIILPVVILYAYTKLVPDISEVLVIVPIYAILACILIFFAFRNSRLFVNPEFIIRQRGAWDIDNDIIEPHKIQTIKLKQYFWQKMSDIGVIKIYTAGGDISFGVANFTQLQKLANYWLYQVETTDKHWM